MQALFFGKTTVQKRIHVVYIRIEFIESTLLAFLKSLEANTAAMFCHWAHLFDHMVYT